MFITVVTVITLILTNFTLLPYLEARNERDKLLLLQIREQQEEQIYHLLN